MNSGGLPGLELQLNTVRKHRCQFPATQEDWLGRKTPMPLNPGTDLGRARP